MRWIFKYNEQAAKYIGKLTKTKLKVEPQPWLHVAVKTMSGRNPWSGYVIYVWDTRKVLDEYRSNKGLFKTELFKKDVAGMQRAVDNRKPLVGGRDKDVNEFFEFGEFDASKSEYFDGAERKIKTDLYNRRTASGRFGNESVAVEANLEQGMYLKDEKIRKLTKLAATECNISFSPMTGVIAGTEALVPKWGVFKAGGSIGTQGSLDGVVRYIGRDIFLLMTGKIYDDAEKAKEQAKSYRSMLSKREKSYYSIKYRVFQLTESDLVKVK